MRQLHPVRVGEGSGDHRAISLWTRLLLVLLGFSSVASLLAWVYGISSFRTAFLAITIPGAIFLLAAAVVGVVRSRSELRSVLAIGTIAGLLGTIGYDVFRIPFIYGGGFLLLSPIESYGVLATGAETSSGWTDFVGWTYHISNGVGFGIAYATIAMRRHWAWGVVYAAILETGTVLTPFASAYQLEGKWFIIGVAYAAHVPFGLALGKSCQDPERTRHLMRIFSRHTAPAALMVVVAGMAVWLSPWSTDSNIERGRAVAAGPSMVVQSGVISPEFVVLRSGACVAVLNSDGVQRTLTVDGLNLRVAPASITELCPPSNGVHRIRTGAGPFTGGFLIVDPEQ